MVVRRRRTVRTWNRDEEEERKNNTNRDSSSAFVTFLLKQKLNKLLKLQIYSHKWDICIELKVHSFQSRRKKQKINNILEFFAQTISNTLDKHKIINNPQPKWFSLDLFSKWSLCHFVWFLANVRIMCLEIKQNG